MVRFLFIFFLIPVRLVCYAHGFHVIPSLSSPVYLVCDALVEVLWLLVCYVVRAQPAGSLVGKSDA